MTKAYARINWVNQPSTRTALGATNLNKIDLALDVVDNRVVSMDTTKLDTEVGNQLVADITVDNNGVFTIKKLDGTTTTYDTKLEKIAVNFEFDTETQQLIITLDDGTKQYVDMSELITEYEFLDSSTIAYTKTGGKISSNVKNGSITGAHLQPNYLADITVQSQKASTSATLASDYATQAKRYAIGIDTASEKDNAKYYMEQARIARDQAEDISNVGIASETKLGLVKGNGNVSVDNTDGAMWANAYKDKGTATGTFINFKNADDALAQVNIKGKSTQVVTKKGKNLLPSPTSTETINGITFTVNSDGTLTLNGTSTGNFNYVIFDDASPIKPVLEVGTYTMKKTGKSEARLSIRKLQSTDAYMVDTTDYTFTLTEPFTIGACFITITSGAIFNNYKIEPQIEVGTVSTTYEKYSVDSPSPDYPSPIVSAQNFDLVSTGKNLTDVPEGLEVGVANIHRIIDLSPNQTHLTVTMSKTLKVASTALGSQHWILFRDGNGNNITSGRTICGMNFSTVGETKSASQTIEIPNNARKALLYVNPYFGANSSTFISNYVQVEYGSTSTPYTPHKEDRINIPYELGEWNEIKDNQHIQGAETVVYDGSSNTPWGYSVDDIAVTGDYALFYSGLQKNGSQITAISNLFPTRNSTLWNATTEGLVLNGAMTQITVKVKKERLVGWNDSLTATEKVNLFKTWLQNNNLVVRYKIATPIYTTLNTYLKTFAKETNIYTTATPQPEITATYKSQSWATNYNTQNVLDTKQDKSKLVNNLASTDPTTYLSGPMGKQLKSEIDNITKINPSSTLKGYFSVGETLLQFANSCTTNTTKMRIGDSPTPSDVPSAISSWEFIAEVIVGDDLRKIIYLHPFGSGKPYSIKRMVFSGAWYGEWENTHQAIVKDNTDANNLVEDGWYNCYGGLNLPDSITRWMINVKRVDVSGVVIVYQTAYNYYGGVGYTSPRTRHVYGNESGSYIWGEWQDLGEPKYTNISINHCTTLLQIAEIIMANPSKTGVGEIGALDASSGLKTLLGNPVGFKNYTRVNARYVSERVIKIVAVGLHENNLLAESYLTFNNVQWQWTGWRNIFNETSYMSVLTGFSKVENDKNVVFRDGNTVTITFGMLSENALNTTNLYNMFTIPEGYNPSGTGKEYGMATVCDSFGYPVGYGMIEVGTNKNTVSFRSATAHATGMRIRGSITYVINSQ